MSIATEGEICYAAGSYYSVGFSQATKAEFLRGATASPPSVRQKLADLLTGATKLNAVTRPAPMRSTPDESFAIPMQERYLHHDTSAGKLTAPTSARACIVSPATTRASGETLVDMMPGQIKALSLEEFRARFEATDPHALRPSHIILIDGDKDLSAIAHDVLDRKTREKEKQPPKIAHDVHDRKEDEPGVVCVRLPKQLETFIAEQIKAGLYSDASEVISDSLRFFQAETTVHFLRIALERETKTLARARERRASELETTA